MRNLGILFFTFVFGSAFAQQLPQYSQYQRNAVMINPGAVGAYDFTDITLGGRYQWMGFEHSPRTAYGYVSTTLGGNKSGYNPSLRTSRGPVASPKVGVGKLKHGVGGEVYLDEFGAFRKLSFAGIYAVHLPVSRYTNLSMGVKAGISNNQFFQDRAVVLSQMPGFSGTQLIDGTYDAFIANQSSLNSLDLGIGMYYYGEKFFVGLSADQLTRDMVTFGTGTADFNQQIHSKFIAGYKFNMNRDWTIQPSVLVKYMQPAPLSFDATVQFEYMEWIWFGLSYRNQDALIGMVGMNINERFKFGYSYDLTTSDLNSSSNGSHELILGVMLGR
jgi:type IX secretion system PorP/SprF family membrane protein